MRRRGLLAAADLAMPRIARSQDARILGFIPQVDLPLLDPVTNNACITHNHRFAMFDSLFGQDSAYAPQPTMTPRCWRGTA